MGQVNGCSKRGLIAARLCAMAALTAIPGLNVWAAEPNSQRVNHFMGAAGESIAIQAPPFHGIEPRLAISYSSEARNGFAGFGWSLGGVSVIERANGQWNTWEDSFTLDGQTLLECQAGWSYPSCATGGTHYTHQESYLKIKRVSDALWEVYGKDGTRTDFTPIYTPPGFPAPYRYGQSKVTDTHGNTVIYTWDINSGGIEGNTYPRTVTYEGSTGSGYRIELFREARPDPVVRYAPNALLTQSERLKSVVISLTTGPRIRAYGLGYTTSAATGKSLLSSVQVYGADVQVDGAGAITGGTAFPARTFSYTPDAAAASFSGDVQMGFSGPPPTPAGTAEDVVWMYLYGTEGVGAGNTLQSLTLPGEYKYASGSRAISSGSGYLDFIYTTATQHYLYAGQYAIAIGNGNLWLMANGAVVAGPYSVNHGEPVRLQIEPTGAILIVNGVPKATHVVTTTYPMNVVAYMLGDGEQISNVRLTGSLVNAYSASCAGMPLFSGDFNGDSRADTVCRTADGGGLAVSLANATGFGSPTLWGASGNFLSGAGDFNNDGRDDVVFFDSWNGYAYVGLSNGHSFGAITFWGETGGYLYPWTAGGYVACRMNGAYIGKVADYNGDGKADLPCIVPGESRQYVAISTGSSFLGMVFGGFGCDESYGNQQVHGQADFNGDGRDDWYCVSSYTGDLLPMLSFGAYLSAGYALQNFCSVSEYSLGDWNGDGATDVACANNGRVALQAQGGLWIDQGTSGTFCVSGQRLTADLDGDGAAEWICNNPGIPANDIEVRRWTGVVMGPATTWKGAFCGGTVATADFNGDGKRDLICESTGLVTYAGTKGLKADLLAASTNGIGGTRAITWATSTDIAHGPDGAVSTAGLPAKYLVAATTSDDGRTAPTTTSFVYYNGRQDDEERKFFGFQYVNELLPMLPSETDHPMIQRKFRIDKLAPGRLEQITRWSRTDGQAKLLSSTVHEYMAGETTGVGARRTAYLVATWNYQYSGLSALCSAWPCADARRTRQNFTYDEYGNLKDVISHGDVDVSGDETLTTNYYMPNTNAYIVGLVGATNVWEGALPGGALRSSEVTAYDGASWWSTAPVKGNATARYSWIAEQARYTAAEVTAYDAAGNVVSRTDATGRTTSATYDPSFRMFPLTATNGATETSTTTWDPICGTASSFTEPNGAVTSFETDELCRPTTTTLSTAGTVSVTSYSALGNPSTQRVRVETPGPDGTNDWSESYFDGLGRTYRTVKRGPTSNESILVDVDFNARGAVAAQTSPYYANEAPKVTTFTYDPFDRMTKTTLPDANERSVVYGAISGGLFQSTQTNELNQSSTARHDVHGRPRETEKVTSLHGTLVTTRNYDVLGRMTSLVDPAGNAWTYTFDSLGRMLSKSDPDAGTSSYTYDDAGRLLSQTDAKAQTITFEYDAAGRPLRKRIRPTGGATGAITETVESIYGTSTSANNVGRVAQLVRKNGARVEQNGKLAFEYDALGRVKKQTRTIDSTDYVVERNYDSAGYLRGMKYPDNDILGEFGGTGTALGYDGAGRLTSIPGILAGVTYNALGAPLVQTNANGTTTTKTYDANRFWLTDIDTSAPSLTLQNLHYTLNDAGMATAVDSDVTNEAWAYAYDELNRLTSSTNGVPANNQTWSYDEIGRIQSNSRVGNYDYPPATNSARPHAPWQIGGGPLGLSTFAYDANGNMLSGNGRLMTWNPENMITQVVANSRTTTFTYGPDGDRIKKAEGSTVLRYPFGDDYEIATDGTVTKYFNAGFGPIAKKVAGTLYWLYTDRLGSINATTDDTGAQVLRRSFRSYGELLGQTGTHAESLGYIGQRTDEETANGSTDDKGLTYLHARYYDSALGIFLSPDPIGADRNAYRYSAGDPINLKDPSGEACFNVGTESEPDVRCVDVVDVFESGTGQQFSGVGPCDFLCQKQLIALGGLNNPNSPQVQQCLFTGTCDVPDGDGGPGTGGTSGDPVVDALQAAAGVTDAVTPAETIRKVLGTDPTGTVNPNSSHYRAGMVSGTVASAVAPVGLGAKFVKAGVTGVLARGSTANLVRGSTVARNLREQLAIAQAMGAPTMGRRLPLTMTDPRWPASEGWAKMQYMVKPGGEPINVHYVLNTLTGAIDDFKIILPRP